MRFYKTGEIAELLGVNVDTVRDWIAAGKLAAIRPAKHWRVTQTALDAFLYGDRTRKPPVAAGVAGTGPPAHSGGTLPE